MRTLFVFLLLLVVSPGCARRGSGIAGVPGEGAVRADALRICVVDQGRLTEVVAEFDAQRGDTLVGGRPFSQIFPAGTQYAADAPWQVRNEPFTFMGACYLKFGAPQIAAAAGLRRVGVHRGVSLFAETDDAGERPAVIYVPLRPGCYFQRYQYELLVRPCEVRG